MQLYDSRLARPALVWVAGWQGGGVLLELENLQNVANCVKTTMNQQACRTISDQLKVDCLYSSVPFQTQVLFSNWYQKLPAD